MAVSGTVDNGQMRNRYDHEICNLYKEMEQPGISDLEENSG
jgi:hypothetical protein